MVGWLLASVAEFCPAAEWSCTLLVPQLEQGNVLAQILRIKRQICMGIAAGTPAVLVLYDSGRSWPDQEQKEGGCTVTRITSISFNRVIR
jgi:hypothetical protein